MARTALLALIAALLAPAAVADEVAVAHVRLVDALPPSRTVEDRLDEIRRRIEAALVYPELARSRAETGSVLVRFSIADDGAARDVRMEHSSGRWLLDRAALRAVAEAAPLPWVWGRLEVPVRFALER
jgi:TonB family protein